MNIVKYTDEHIELGTEFECGNINIDNFLKGGSALDKNQGITYVMLSDDSKKLIGYYNIEAGRVDQIETVGKEEYYKPMGGTININYLAIHSNYQGKKIAEFEGKKLYFGDYLLRDCEKRVLELRGHLGIAFITLCSTKQGYHLYHERSGYEDFEEDMNTVVQESDALCFRLYKCADDIISV